MVNVLNVIRLSIKDVLYMRNSNQAQLAKKMGVSPQALNKVMTSDRVPNVSTIVDISKALDVPAFYLLMTKEERAKWDQLHPGQALKAGPLSHLSSRENLIKAALHLTDEQCRFVVDHIFSVYGLSPEEREQIASELLSSSEPQSKKNTR